MNAVQASLLCDDITKLILENLAPGPPVQSVKTASDVHKKKARHISQLTLARVARTCKGLSSTALDVLWREVDDLIHLLSVFPSFVKITGNQASYTFHGLIKEHDWARFQTYAQRVHVLHAEVGSRLEPSAWLVLFHHYHRNPFLPRLHSLRGWRISNSTSGIAEAMLLQSPELRHLEVDTQQYQDASLEAFQAFLEVIQPALDRLDTLSLHGTIRENKPVREIPFWNLSHLRMLEVTYRISRTYPILDSLLAFPVLETLSLNIDNTPIPLHHADGHAFVSLKSLRLTGDMSNVHNVMGSYSFPNLTQLSLTVQDTRDRPVDNIIAIFHTILKELPEALDTLKLTLTTPGVDYPYAYFSDASGLLEPLHARPSLRALTLHFVNLFANIRDADLRAVEKAWPNLTTVIAFAAAHPRLERFSIPYIGITLIPPLYEVPMDHNLRWFDVKFIESHVPLYTLALTLDRMFPHVEISEDTALKRSWFRGEELKLLMLGLQAGRRAMHRRRELAPTA
ncbi:hypothetical protein C8Q76DRAFT_791143 [Earliella scabrosa]|nr:hypothetical protein C8Q76DRAFT_791143 [Earliella scabrosa]